MISAAGGAERNGGHLVGPAGWSHVKGGWAECAGPRRRGRVTQLLSSHRWPDFLTPPPDFFKKLPLEKDHGCRAPGFSLGMGHCLHCYFLYSLTSDHFSAIVKWYNDSINKHSY